MVKQVISSIVNTTNEADRRSTDSGFGRLPTCDIPRFEFPSLVQLPFP